MVDIIEREIETKSNNIGQTLLEKISLENSYNNFCVLILKKQTKVDFASFEMYGIKAIDYIKNAVNVCETKVVEYAENDDIIKVIKRNLPSKKYVAVVFADTPLLRRHTFLEILDYFIFKQLCALKFNRGYVFECEYLNSVDKIYNPQVQSFNEEDFFKVNDSNSYSLCLDMLKNRILSFHQSRGVIIENLASTFIDADVNIDGGVIIKPNSTIKGKTIIKSGSIIENSVITNAIIEKNCKISNSILTNCVVLGYAKIEDYSVIKNVSIKENAKISNEKIEGKE